MPRLLVQSAFRGHEARRGQVCSLAAISRRGRLTNRLCGLLLLACLPVAAAGCTGFNYLLGPFWTQPAPTNTVELGIAVVQPSTTETAAPGVTTVIEWADVATLAGTTVQVSAQRQDSVGGNIGDPINLIGDGTAGSGRDAIADGNSDVFEWDLTGIRVGDYVITVTITAPDGTSASAVSRDPARSTTGIIRVITALPTPTLTFTAPGAADVTVHHGNTFDITWTDNGTANVDALMTLGLDTDSDHSSGNEIILLRDSPLSTNDNTGTFTFNFLDADGNTVPDGTYTVFARLDDSVHDVVTVSATGKLILAP